MCGVVGIYSWGTSSPPDLAVLRRMRDLMRHRGPDDGGEFLSGPIALGHRRLSIIDLAAGHQPLGNEDGSIQIVFNGEIYNFQSLRLEAEAAGHRFATHSDTEVIVHLYEELGDDVVTRLGGMFAFGLWDGRRQRLLLARDPSGIKPLYYALGPGRLGFASEIRPLLCLPWVSRGIDPSSLDRYLERGYVPAPHTLLRDVAKLPAGHRLVVEDGTVLVEPYGVPRIVSIPDRSEEALGDQLFGELDRSVRDHLVSDVPVGAFLSGGLDSSLIVGLMRRHCTGPLKTFSVAVEGGAAFDETPHARAVARHFGTEHEDISLQAHDMPGLLVEASRFLDEPVSDPAAAPTYVVAKLAAQHLKVVLTGEGADETWGGYADVFRKGAIVARYRRLPGWLRAVTTDPVLRALSTGARLVEASRLPAYAAQLIHIRPEDRRKLLTRETLAEVLSAHDGSGHTGWALDAADPFGSITRDLIPSHLAERHLLKVDRMTMAHSLEARVPFLDRTLVQFALALPGHFKVRGRVTKYLLRQVASRILPEDIRARPKHGFDLPCALWLRTTLVPLVTELFRRTALPDLIDDQATQAIWAEHREGRRDRTTELWNIVTLELWARAMSDG